MKINTKIIDITQKVQAKLNLDIAYFVRSAFWGGAQQVVGVVSGLIVSYLFGHFISKSLFGQYNLVISYISLFTFVSLPGIDTAMVRSVGLGYDASLPYAFTKKLKYSLIGVPLIFFLAIYYFNLKNPAVAATLLIVAFLFPFIHSFGIYTSFLTSKKKFRLLASTAIASSVFFVLTHALSILLAPSLLSLTVAYVLALVIPAMLGYRTSHAFINTQKVDTHLLSYGKFLTLINILPWISGHIGNILLAHFIGIESLAIYSVASRLLISVQKNFIVFHKPVRAKLAQQSNQEHLRTLLSHSSKLLLIGFILAAGMWILTPYYVHFFFTDTYSEAIRYGQLLSLALIPMPLTWVLADMMVYQRKKKIQFYSATVSPILKIILYLVLIPKWQIGALVFILLLERYTDPLIPLYVLKTSKK